MDTPWWAVVSVIINFLVLCVVLVYCYKHQRKGAFSQSSNASPAPSYFPQE
jgi:cbb3-type cytochrome oxidase subunit 3